MLQDKLQQMVGWWRLMDTSAFVSYLQTQKIEVARTVFIASAFSFSFLLYEQVTKNYQADFGSSLSPS